MIFLLNYTLAPPPKLTFLLLPLSIILNKAAQMILVKNKSGHATDLLNSFHMASHMTSKNQYPFNEIQVLGGSVWCETLHCVAVHQTEAANRGCNPLIKPCVLVFDWSALFLSFTELPYGLAEALHLPDLITHHWCLLHAQPMSITSGPATLASLLFLDRRQMNSALRLYT